MRMLRTTGLGSAAARIAIASAVASMLGACTADRVITASAPALDHRQRHPTVLKEGARVLDLFLVGAGGLDPRQRQDLQMFSAEYRRTGRGAIVAQVPVGTRSDIAAQITMGQISAALTRAGLPVLVTTYQVSNPAIAAPIRLTFSRLKAVLASKCGQWPNDLGAADFLHNASNESYWNFGCAVQSNMVAQVDDPVDLVRGRAEAPPDTVRRGKVMDAIREGKDPSTEYRQEGTRINQAVGN
jgi:pilus assembly protein CpaD